MKKGHIFLFAAVVLVLAFVGSMYYLGAVENGGISANNPPIAEDISERTSNGNNSSSSVPSENAADENENSLVSKISGIFEDIVAPLEMKNDDAQKNASAGASGISPIIFDDAIGAGWEMVPWESTSSFFDSTKTFGGSEKSIAVETHGEWGRLVIRATGLFDMSDYKTLSFSLYQSSPDDEFYISLQDKDWRPFTYVRAESYMDEKSVAGNWTRISIPLSDFQIPASEASGIYGFVLESARPAAVNVDKIEFSTAEQSTFQGTASSEPLSESTGTQTEQAPTEQKEPEVSVVAKGPFIYRDGLEAGWKTAGSWGVSVDPAHKKTVKYGSTAMAVDFTGTWGTLFLNTGSAFDISDYSSISFYAHGGEDKPKDVYVMFYDKENILLDSFKIEVPFGRFGAFRVPFYEIQNLADRGAVGGIGFSVQDPGARIYFDDIWFTN
ncbi:hypothetical protein L0Y49_04765 [bacterium]|nr:hypothetical protein [bacterium]